MAPALTIRESSAPTADHRRCDVSMLTVDEVIDTTTTKRSKKKPRGGQAGGRGGVERLEARVPTFIPIVIFSVYPLLRGIYLGFTDAKPGSTSTPPSPGSRTTASCGTTTCSGSRSGSA